MSSRQTSLINRFDSYGCEVRCFYFYCFIWFCFVSFLFCFFFSSRLYAVRSLCIANALTCFVQTIWMCVYVCVWQQLWYTFLHCTSDTSAHCKVQRRLWSRMRTTIPRLKNTLIQEEKTTIYTYAKSVFL